MIFVAYLSALCRNPLHTATQYALLTALAAVGRTYLSSGAGFVAKATGWPMFFVICVAGRGAEPDPAGLAAAARAFRCAGAGEGLSFIAVPREGWGRASRAVDRTKDAATGSSDQAGDDGTCGNDARLMLRHHAPFGDHGFAHLPGVLRAGDFVDLHRDFLADKILQLRGLGVAAGDELERFRAGFQIAEPVRRRQPARLAGELVGGDALALLAAADLHGVEFPGQHVAGIDRLAGLRRRLGLAAPVRDGAAKATAMMAAKPKRLPNCRFVMSISSVVIG